MKKIEKTLSWLLLLSIFLSMSTRWLHGDELILLLVCGLALYCFFVFVFVKILYNRRIIITKTEKPIIFLIAKVYLINIILFSSMVWTFQRMSTDYFRGVGSLKDAYYFVIITFATVGFGDIYPTADITRLLTIFIVCSNISLLVLFINLFVMKSQKKNTYLLSFISSIYVFFCSIAYWVISADSTYSDKKLTWSEWIDVYASMVKKGVWNEKDSEFKRLSFELKRLEESLDFLIANKINLIENENLTEEQFFALEHIRIMFNNINIIDPSFSAIKDELMKDLEIIGYGCFNTVKFSRFDINENRELRFALEGIDISDDETKVWIALKLLFSKLLSL